ncbi:NAD(P)-binding domain-containing protein [Tanacetum coccineum]
MKQRASKSTDPEKNRFETNRFGTPIMTNKDLIVQVVSASIAGDMVLATAYAHELPQYGLKVGLTNYVAGTRLTSIDPYTRTPPLDLIGKERFALIQCAKAMGIQKYAYRRSLRTLADYPFDIFASMFIDDLNLELGLIGQYAVPLLEEKSEVPTRIAYMDTQDIASLTLIALRSEKVNGKFLPSQDC